MYMSRAAISVFVWGIYMLVSGTTFLLIPNVVLPLLGFPTTDEFWIRGMSMLAIALGYFYIQTARHEMLPFSCGKYTTLSSGHLHGDVCDPAAGTTDALAICRADLLLVWTCSLHILVLSQNATG
jgi:hypothetical protein